MEKSLAVIIKGHFKMKENVSLFIYSLDSGGAERLASLIVKDMKKEYNIFLVLMNETIRYDLSNFKNIYFLERSRPTESGIIKFLKLPYLAYKYLLFCRKYQITKSISFLTRPNFIATISKKIGNKAEVVISEHSLVSSQYSKNSAQSIINKYLIRVLYPLADNLIAVSKGVKEDLSNNFKIKKKIKVIYNFIDAKDIEKKSNDKCEFDFSKFTFITIGRLDEGKNHRLIINSMKGFPNAQLLIIGEGKLKQQLKGQIKYLNLESRVFLLGYQKNPYKYLKSSDCFVFASHYESFGISIIEALACRLPVISTDCPSGPREILSPDTDCSFKLIHRIEFAKYGILTPVDNIERMTEAMGHVYNDRSIRRMYINNSTRAICKFSRHYIGFDYFLKDKQVESNFKR